MKNKVLLILTILLLPIMTYAGGQKEETGTIKIGISKIVEHPALNAIEQGIQDELADLGYTNIEYDLQNAAGDMNTAAQIAAKFKMEKVNVAIGIATPTAIALATGIKDIPVVFSAVTDPIDAGLVDDFTSGKNNITGVSDMTPVKEQIKLMAKILDIKTLGHIYTAGEPNAVKLAEMAEATAAELGMKFVAAAVSNSSEVTQAALSIVGKVDAIYISTDNTVVSGLGSVVATAMKAGVPVITADPTSAADSGVLAAYGFDYYKHGRLTGRLVDRVLKGEDPATIPTQFMTDESDLTLVLNLDVAKELGITISADLIKQASTIIENGQVK
ncbi:MAG: ABC transporter substrate-binding protein [Spirochaetaceae bacterium]|nr:ABC transporter substrate-binding protein [Spirochaetaceae bacterium]